MPAGRSLPAQLGSVATSAAISPPHDWLCIAQTPPIPMFSSVAPRCTLHLRIQRCDGLRSAVDGRSDTIDAFVVAQMHPHAAPDLATLRSSPPPAASSATSHRSRTRSGGVAAWQFDASLHFTHASDWVSLAVCDAATPAAAATGSASSASLRRIIGAVCIPVNEVLEQSCVDRWFDLHPPTHAPSASASSSAGLAQFCPEAKAADAIIAVAPNALDDPQAHISPLGRIRVQMFAVGADCLLPLWRGGVSGSLAFPEESARIGLHVVTWNAGNAPLPDDMRALLPKSCYPASAASPSSAASDHEEMPVLIAIGLQECAYTPMERDLAGVPLAASLEGSVIAAFTRLIPASYTRVHAHALGEMRLLLFVLSEWRSDLSGLTLDAVPCGIGNLIANKGMILCSFRIRDTSIALVTGHLAAHTDKLAQRNKDLALVARAVAYPFESAAGTASLSAVPAATSSLASSDFLSSFHAVYLFGDLNYRLEYPRGCADRTPSPAAFQQVVNLVRAQAWPTLFGFDQLRAAQARGEALVGFRESPPTFAPSFKVLRNVGLGYNAKRIPSWCDRILYKSVFNAADDAGGAAPDGSGKQQHPASDSAAITQQSLRLVCSLCSSDHKPVVAGFLFRSFWCGGRTDHALGGAEMELAAWKTDAAALIALLGRESSFAGVVELRAAFLSEPILLPLSSLSSSAGIAFPLAFNSPLRIRRELVLVRLFKSSSALLNGSSGVAASVTPLARGLCVIDCGCIPLAADATSKRVPLSVQMLRPGGALALVLQTVVTLRWKNTKGVVTASTAAAASAATGPASSPSASASKLQAARTLAAIVASDRDEDLFQDDADALLSPASFAVLSAQPRSKQPAVVKRSALGGSRLPSSSPTSRNKPVSTSSTIAAAPVLEASKSSMGGAPAAAPSKALTIPAHASKFLLLLVALVASSEASYVKALDYLHRAYHLPLVRLVSATRIDFSAAATPAAMHVTNLCGASLPLLLSVHSTFLGALEAQLHQLSFGGDAFSPVEALRLLAQLLTQLLPLLSLYHSASLSASAAAWLNADAATSPDPLRNQARALIAQVDSTARSSSLTFDALTVLVSQRVCSYQLWIHELLHVLDRQPSLTPLASTFAEILAGFDRLQAQTKTFSEWYPSLAQQEAQREEDALYASLAGESAAPASASSSLSGGMVAVADGKGVRDSMAMFPAAARMRPSTAAVLQRPATAAQWPRDHSALDLPLPPPPATGCRPATSVGDVDDDASGGTRGPTNATYMLASKVAAQLRSRRPLPGFHPYLRSHCTQEDCSIAFRADGLGRHSKFTPPRARALSVGSLELFDFKTKTRVPGLFPSAARPRSNSGEWSLQRACASLGIGASASDSSSAPAAAPAHWSTRLPKAFRTLQAGRSLLALVDLQSVFATSSAASADVPAASASSSRRPSPPPPIIAAPAPAPSPVSARAFAMDAADEASLYDDEFLQLDEAESMQAASDHTSSTPAVAVAAVAPRGSVDDHIDPALSMGSEMIQKVLAASAAAHRGPAVATRRVIPAQATAASAAPSSRPAASAASSSSPAAVAASMVPPSSRRPVASMPRPPSASRHGVAATSASHAAAALPPSPRKSAPASAVAAAPRVAPLTRPGGAGIVRHPSNPLTLSTAFRSAANSSSHPHQESDEPELPFQLKPRTRPQK